MSTNTRYKELALRGLRNLLGDDAYRAQLAFARFTEEEMNEQHGQSGKTRAQVLKEYKDHETDVKAAIEWLKGMRE